MLTEHPETIGTATGYGPLHELIPAELESQPFLVLAIA